MDGYKIYKTGVLDEILNKMLIAVNNESLIPGAFELECTENKRNELEVSLVEVATKSIVNVDSFIDERKKSFSFSIKTNIANAMVMGFFYYDESDDINQDNDEFLETVFKVDKFTRRELLELSRFLGRELGMPTDFNREEDFHPKQNYICLESPLKASIGIFSRIFEDVKVYVSANDSFSPGNRLYFGINLQWAFYKGGTNGSDFPALSGASSFYFDKAKRTWHMNEY